MAAPNNLVPDHVDGSLSFSILTYLKKIKHQVSFAFSFCVISIIIIIVHSYTRLLAQFMEAVTDQIPIEAKRLRR